MPERKNEAIWIESRERWQINVQMDGIRKTFSSATPGRKGKAAAERKADAWLNGSALTTDSNVGILLDQYIKYLEDTKSAGHSGQYEGFVRLYIKPIIGAKRMSKLTEGDLQAVIDMAYAKRNLAEKTLKDVRGCMKNWLKWCRKRGLTKMYAEDIAIPAGAKKSEKRIVEPAGLKKLMSSALTTWHCKEHEDWFIHAYRFAVYTGLRPGELLGLERQDIKGAKITIRRAYNVRGEITQGKNNNARRTIQIPPQAVEELRAQLDMLKKVGIISPYVFPDKSGGRTREGNLYQAWQRYCKYNGILPVSLYELRHTYVSVNKEMPAGLKKLTVGHSRDMDTEGVYGHVMAGDLEKAAGFAEEAFKKILQVQ